MSILIMNKLSKIYCNMSDTSYFYGSSQGEEEKVDGYFFGNIAMFFNFGVFLQRYGEDCRYVHAGASI